MATKTRAAKPETFDMGTVAGTVKAMLVEGTGSHMLDSGGAYGRHWDRNQRKPPWGQPRLLFDSDGDLMGLNVYHYLVEDLDRLGRGEEVRALEAEFRRWVDAQPVREAYYNSPGTVEEWLATKPGFKHTATVNTYNGECSLSQVLCWVGFEDGDGHDVVALSIHQGCDVRGGYTDFRFFNVHYDAWPYDGLMRASCNCGYGWEQYHSAREKKPEPKTDAKRAELLCPECGETLWVGVR